MGGFKKKYQNDKRICSLELQSDSNNSLISVQFKNISFSNRKVVSNPYQKKHLDQKPTLGYFKISIRSYAENANSDMKRTNYQTIHNRRIRV